MYLKDVLCEHLDGSMWNSTVRWNRGDKMKCIQRFCLCSIRGGSFMQCLSSMHGTGFTSVESSTSGPVD